jgi:hypothetical protein
MACFLAFVCVVFCAVVAGWIDMRGGTHVPQIRVGWKDRQYCSFQRRAAAIASLAGACVSLFVPEKDSRIDLLAFSSCPPPSVRLLLLYAVPPTTQSSCKKNSGLLEKPLA